MPEEPNSLAFFERMYEGRRRTPEKKHPAPERWDERAEGWGRELRTDCPFRRSMDDRVRYAARFLSGKGLLRPDMAVMDIGCGPGRYAAEFAKTAGHVTGIDISGRMLELAREYALEQGRSNVSFETCDFLEIDPRGRGWEKRFDLVFASITPAVTTLDGLDKAMLMSRGYCFHSSFLYWWDELEEKIGRSVFGAAHGLRQLGDWRGHYALFNLLFLRGYLPETHYHRQKINDRGFVTPDMARYYASLFTAEPALLEENTGRVFRYLEAEADDTGMIEQRYERWYAWVLWDVRENSGLRA